MTASMKRQLVNRLVGFELKSWRSGLAAGQKVALNYLTVAGFEAVTSMKNPSFQKLRTLLRSSGETELAVDKYWCEVAGYDFGTVSHHPDFALAFVAAVREVWNEVHEEVTAELDACPRPHQTDEPTAESVEEGPARRSRRGPSRRRAGPRPDLHRRW